MNDDEEENIPPSPEVELSMAYEAIATMFRGLKTQGLSEDEAAAVVAKVMKGNNG